jgi:hypothetical protein
MGCAPSAHRVLLGQLAGEPISAPTRCRWIRSSRGTQHVSGHSRGTDFFGMCVFLMAYSHTCACTCVCSRLRSRPCRNQRLPGGLRQDHRRPDVSSRGGGPREDVRRQLFTNHLPERLLSQHRVCTCLPQHQSDRRRRCEHTAAVQTLGCAPTAAPRQGPLRCCDLVVVLTAVCVLCTLCWIHLVSSDHDRNADTLALVKPDDGSHSCTGSRCARGMGVSTIAYGTCTGMQTAHAMYRYQHIYMQGHSQDTPRVLTGYCSGQLAWEPISAPTRC